MNLDELKEPWKKRHADLADRRVEELASRVLVRASEFEKTILRRDLIETVAALIVALIFGFCIQQDSLPWIAKLGIGFIILGVIEVVVLLHWTRRRGDRPRHDLPLAEFCAAEIARIDRQIWLLRNVNWWYTGPSLLGACLFIFGILWIPHLPLHISLSGLAIFFLLAFVFGWMIYRINQRAIRQELMPLREELLTIADFFRDDSPADGATP